MVRGCLLAILVLNAASAQTYDVLIRNAHILDGAGNPWFSGDVAIQGDRIVAVGRLDPLSAATVVDAAGLTLAPGFIDTHSHGIRGIQETPSAENQIRQGVTTIIEGPDGSSPIPLRPFLDKLGGGKIGVNFGMLAGHGSIRQKVMGSENRRATSDELERMKELTRQAMLDGAFGLSTGLFYVP
ncbi:MAG: amidohydrolase family protein, partial [Acidobacteria bacterium]|nr:amidohydrolase family protein [Acidobacteriota bacterium]